ncbi:hypothetical protein COCC4DRAFT_30885 [Bipolaris maydis ATCC 48331]|uniref:Uncharacterized protein n=2 Tax=Cochliobolus heterostrophus TaxID=5016 RepID=M2U6Y5_COCH5|nr:uncharacterized protein COCC4DRAFT_30885 [Bipolaris maydis ATCC 48331]EMD94264.1 hypothetical protein COCHEDRAFT_1020285 [Bipolaris maydis C5]ENI07438.1 hypothetical protein COCC4DRAFT_30885 [Bipolaris maydis ATCC 48331]
MGLLGWRVGCQVVLLSGHNLDRFEHSQPRRDGCGLLSEFFSHCRSPLCSNTADSRTAIQFVVQ